MAEARKEEEDPLLEEAFEFLLAVESAPEDVTLRVARDAWVAKSELHARAWRRAEYTWRLSGELSKRPEMRDRVDGASFSTVGGRTPLSSARPAPVQPRRRFVSSRWAALAAAMLVALAFTLQAPDLLIRMKADYVTGSAEVRDLLLPDGSRLFMDAHSAVAVDFSPEQRRVRLIGGAAFFEVKSDALRPFVVTVESARVTAVGTAFSVEIANGWLSTAVSEGRVRFDRQGADVEVVAGEELSVEQASGRHVRRLRDPAYVASWRNRRLVADNETIGTIVDRLANHHRGIIITLDGQLARKRVTGIYDLSRPIDALRAVVEPYGGSVREISPYLVLIGGI
ncbi:FecR family protein [Pseudochelatococcus sp. B33]